MSWAYQPCDVDIGLLPGRQYMAYHSGYSAPFSLEGAEYIVCQNRRILECHHPKHLKAGLATAGTELQFGRGTRQHAYVNGCKFRLSVLLKADTYTSFGVRYRYRPAVRFQVREELYCVEEHALQAWRGLSIYP